MKKNMAFLSMKHVRFFTTRMQFNFLTQTILMMKTVSFYLE